MCDLRNWERATLLLLLLLLLLLTLTLDSRVSRTLRTSLLFHIVSRKPEDDREH
jgi:uncharacterized membrane protein affecting hemolysin expression